ncbi:hypothetical protein INT44_000422 [Umbelopsis vinacea]|uniref:Uncharacterized protein n=1 Tax=Umbelopsis vinacea TaxID=44442 RepID=A0A8H7UDY7_9FUNG|nr:hypothetical protein INT44_000422 [Umbelopsis vinacea]
MSDAASITPARNHAAEQPRDGDSLHSNEAEEYYEKPPQKKRFYRQKKYWIICGIISTIVTLVVILLIIFVFFPMIAQLIINKSNISVNSANIAFTPPTDGTEVVKRQESAPFMANGNNTFYMKMDATLGNTGPFPADLAFTSPIAISYNNTELGRVHLPGAHVSGGHGSLISESLFNITNLDAFTAFTKDMLALDKFKWNLKGSATIKALSRTANVNLDKDVEIPGMGGFPKVKITSFALPGDDPAGGIQVSLGTTLTNPSSIGVYLGTIQLAIGYQGVYLGPVQASNVNLTSGDNNITLNGRLVPQTDPNNLNVVSDLFTRYIAGEISNTTATGVAAMPDGVNSISWLSEGFKTVQLNVGLAATEKLQLIHGVSLGDLDLVFTDQTAYSPISTAPQVTANFSIPFGFSLNITEVTQNITLGTNATGPIALLSSGYSNSTSNQQTGVLSFGLNNAPLQVYPDKHEAFNTFNYNLTASNLYSFNVAGNASVVTSTPIGVVKLTGVPLNATTSLNGLQFLNSTPTIINGIDVTGGTSDYLIMAINVTMYNPSSVQITAGDVSLLMQSQGTNLGTVTLPNLTLYRGTNNVVAIANFDPKSTTVGQNLLTTFVGGQDNTVGIAGDANSTIIQSLAYAFGNVSLESNLPGLKSKLIQSAGLTVYTNTVQTNVAGTTVSIANPFSAGLSITQVKAAVTYAGMPVGNIDADISSNPIVVGGKATANSPAIPITMNLEPAAVALLLRMNAESAGLNLQPIDALLTMGGFNIQGQDQITGSASTFNGFNISDFVIKAFANLHVDLQLSSVINIGQYTDTLAIVQTDVPTKTDDSITYLIPIVGQPIVQAIINQASLTFSSAMLSSPTDGGFAVQLNGQLTGTGPFAATIGFPVPLDVAWNGQQIGKVTMPNIQTVADVGATFSVAAQFQVVSESAMADFTAYLLLEKSFVWDISSPDVSVTALDYTFTNLTLTKSVTLLGMGGLVNDVKINSFDLPSNDPAGGIHLVLDTTIYNPSQVGVNLQGLGFEAFFGSVDLGPVAGTNVILNPQASSSVPMAGRLQAQSSQDGLNALQTLFDNYLGHKETPLSVKGAYGSGPSGQVNWLSEAFQKLTIDNIMLPGGPDNLTLIPAVTIKQFTFDFTKGAYAPDSSSNDIEAQFKNPFGFPLSITGLQESIDIGAAGHDMATLAPPYSPATTDTSTGIIKTGFEHVPFQVHDDAHEVFNQFVKGLTLTSGGTMELKGNISKSGVSTAAGDFFLSGISYDVQSAIPGFNDFGGQFSINSVAVTGATPQYIIIKLTISLTNPSFITISIGDISFDTYYNNVNIGPTLLKAVTIPPGTQQYQAEFHLTPSAASATTVAQVLSGYLQGQVFALTVKGSDNSTSIDSLKEGLAGVSLAGTLTGINSKLITGGVVKNLNIDSFPNIGADTYITIQNPLDVGFSITAIKAQIYYQGTTYFELASIDATLSSPFTIPAKGTATSGPIPLTFVDPLAHLVDILKILVSPSITVDINQNATVVVGDGFNGVLAYSQKGVVIQNEILSSSLTGLLNLPQLANSSALAGVASVAKSDISGGIAVATSVVGDVTSLVGGVASAVVSDASSVVGDVTSVVGDVTSVVGDVTSAVGGEVKTLVGDATSAIGGGVKSIVGDATSIVGDILPKPTSTTKKAADSTPTPTPGPKVNAAETHTTTTAAATTTKAKPWPFNII